MTHLCNKVFSKIVLECRHQEWSKIFEADRSLLERVFSGIPNEIQQVGSTAVPGLPAKPVADIAVRLDSIENASDHVAAMVSSVFIRYAWFGDLDFGSVLTNSFQGISKLAHNAVISVPDLGKQNSLSSMALESGDICFIVIYEYRMRAGQKML